MNFHFQLFVCLFVFFENEKKGLEKYKKYIQIYTKVNGISVTFRSEIPFKTIFKNSTKKTGQKSMYFFLQFFKNIR